MKDTGNSDELRDVAPTLSSIEKKESFSVPAGYFDALPDQIMNRINADPLANAAVNPFAVPDGYFEKLPAEISNRIATKKGFGLAEVLKSVLRPQYSLSLITACFVLFVCIRFFEKPVVVTTSDVAEANISSYEADLLSQVDESILAEGLEDAPALLAAQHKSNDEKEIEDYIIAHNIDLYEIANEL